MIKKIECDNLFYLHLQKLLDERMPPCKFMPIIEAEYWLKFYKIPEHLRYGILYQMEQQGLIERIKWKNTYNIKVVNSHKHKLLDDHAKLYHKLGVW